MVKSHQYHDNGALEQHALIDDTNQVCTGHPKHSMIPYSVGRNAESSNLALTSLDMCESVILKQQAPTPEVLLVMRYPDVV